MAHGGRNLRGVPVVAPLTHDAQGGARVSDYPAAFRHALARTWLVVADDDASRATIEATCDRPELRPLLHGVSLVARRAAPVPYRATGPATIEVRPESVASRAAALLSIRHALELAMWRRLLPPGAGAFQAVAAAALALHAAEQFMGAQPPDVRAAALAAAPPWLARLIEGPAVEPAARFAGLVEAWADLVPLLGDAVTGPVRDADLARAQELAVALAPAASPAELLLTSGGDSRLRIDPATGLNKYGCSPAPRPHAVTFSSCTATSASELAFSSAEAARRALLGAGLRCGSLSPAFDETMTAIRSELAALLGADQVEGSEVVLAASGTDCELLALEIALCGHDAPLTNIVVGPDEIGSGSVAASEGLHFDSIAPLVPSVDCGSPIEGIGIDRVHVERVGLRDRHGSPIRLARLDGEVGSIIGAAVARGHRVLLHLLDSSKTGLRAPSVPAATRLASRYDGAVDVIVDSAQLRTSRERVAAYLRAGFMVIATGSKFFTGSPFAGALLLPTPLAGRLDRLDRLPAGLQGYLSRHEVPHRWRRLRGQLPGVVNPGLLLRWQAALHEMRAFAAVPDADRRRYLQAFHDGALRMLGRHDGLTLVDAPVGDRGQTDPSAWDEVRTIFTFVATRGEGAGGRPMTYDEAWSAYCWLNRDVCRDLPPEASTGERALAARACHIGQPVKLDAAGRTLGALRIAVGARFVSRVAFDASLGDDPEGRVAAQLADLEAVVGKLAVLRRYWDDIARSADSAADAPAALRRPPRPVRP